MSRTAGPVLVPSDVGLAVLSAIRAENPTVQVQDRGSYLRVSVPERCVARRQAIELALGRPFEMPSDLEQVMPSFKGRLRIDAEEAIWEAVAT